MTERPKLQLVGDAIDDLGLGRWENVDWESQGRRVDELRAKEGAEAERAARTDRWDALLRAGWPERALEVAEQADESTAAMCAVLAWNMTVANVLVLAGPPGIGKTVAAARFALDRKHAPPTFLRAAAFARSSRFDQDERRGWLNAGALVLDDLSTEDAKGSFVADLDELIDVFYGSRRPLLITTNLVAVEFKRKYGERIADRLREAGKWIAVAGESLRKPRPTEAR